VNSKISKVADLFAKYAESGAAYHLDVTGGSSQVTMQSAWWTGCTLNNTFYTSYPRIKLMMHFEYVKTEIDGGISDLRDYRITNATDVLAAFQADLSPAATQFAWANIRQAPASIPSAGRPADLPGGSQSVSSTSGLVFQTARILDLGSPSLFGVTAGANRAVELGFGIGLTLVAGLVGGYSVLSRRSP